MRHPATRWFPAELVESYAPLEVLGMGSYGVVFRCRDRGLGRDVCLKVLRGEGGDSSGARMLLEAQVLARLRHPNVVGVFAAGETAQGPYLVLEHLDGLPLDKVEVEDPLEVMLQVADGLAAVHAAGVLHRDLKPGNVLLTEAGRAVLVDFGLALDPGRTRVTRSGAVVGTLAYLAPELLEGEPPSPASDWYAWGATLYALLEGRLAFRPREVLSRSAWKGGGPDFHVVDGRSLEAQLVRATLEPDPAKRLASREAIDALLTGRSGSTSRLSVGGTLTVDAARRKSRRKSRRAARGSRDPARSLPLPAAVLGAGVVLAGLAMGMAGRLIGGGPPPPPTPATALPTPRGEMVAEVARDLGRELEQLLARGAQVDLADPVRWGGILGRLAGVRRFVGWLEAGGRPEDLPAGERAELVKADEAWEAAGLPRPLFPYLYIAPAQAGMDAPPEVVADLEGTAPARLEGWLATAVRAYVRARSIQRALDRELARQPRGPYPGGIVDPGISAIFSLGEPNLRRFLVASYASPAHRTVLARTLADGVEEARRCLYALARSIRDEPATRERVGVVARRAVLDLHCFLFGHLAGMDPRAALGGLSPHRAGALLAAALVAQGDMVGRAYVGSRDRLGEAARLARDAIGPGEGPWGAQRHGHAVLLWMELQAKRRDLEAMETFLRTEDFRPAGPPADLATRAVHRYLLTLHEMGTTGGLDRARRRELADGVARNRDALDDGMHGSLGAVLAHARGG